MIASPAVVAFVMAVTWFGAFVAAHIAGWRAGLGNARWLLISYASSVVAMLISVAGWSGASQTAAVPLLPVLLALMTSACLFVLYVPAVYVVLTSLSVQTLIMLRRAGGALPAATLYDHFAGRSVLDDRLATMVASGYLAVDGGRLRLTARGLAVAKTFAFIKRLWQLGPGG